MSAQSKIGNLLNNIPSVFLVKGIIYANIRVPVNIFTMYQWTIAWNNNIISWYSPAENYSDGVRNYNTYGGDATILPGNYYSQFNASDLDYFYIGIG